MLIFLLLPLVAGRAQPAPPRPATRLEQFLRSQAPIDLSAPPSATAWFEPATVRPGERAVYRVRINALEASIQWPETLAASGLALHLTAQGQIYQGVAGAFRPLTIFNYEARASQPGTFSVPAFTVEVYGQAVPVPAAQLEVRADAAARGPRRLLIEAEATNVFVGQRVDVRVLLPGSVSNTIETVTQVQLNGDGFLVNRNVARQSIQATDREGRRVPTYIYETVAVPITTGELPLSAQGFTAGRDFDGPIIIRAPVTIPGGAPNYVLLESDPVTIRVRPLPAAGKLPGFTGAVGTFSCDPPQLSTNRVRVGDPVQLTLVVRGGDLSGGMVPPDPPRPRDWQVLLTGPKEGVNVAGAGRPGIAFTYTMIPLTDAVSATPAIPYSYFDPARAAYVDLTVPPVPVQVVPGGAAVQLEPPADLRGDEAAAPELTLSDFSRSPGRTVSTLVPVELRSGFLVVQAAPAILFAALWFWDRRRRFLQQHPQIVRCRRARRQLRREKRRLLRAVSDGDTPAFTRSAIRALQVAAAPQYPATPDALVCRDVLDVLDASDRQGKSGGTVRRFFAAADARSFAKTSAVDVDLFPLHADLDEVLTWLDERLRRGADDGRPNPPSIVEQR